MKNCHPLSYFLFFSKNPYKFPSVLTNLVQIKTNCVFLFIALTACNVASGIRVFQCRTQYPWKYKILPYIRLKSTSKEIFYNCTSDDELDHLLSHFARAIDRLKVLNEKLSCFFFWRTINLFKMLTYKVAALTRWPMRSFRSLPVAELPKWL